MRTGDYWPRPILTVVVQRQGSQALSSHMASCQTLRRLGSHFTAADTCLHCLLQHTALAATLWQPVTIHALVCNGVQREEYNASGRITRTAEEEFMDSFGGGTLSTMLLVLSNKITQAPQDPSFLQPLPALFLCSQLASCIASSPFK